LEPASGSTVALLFSQCNVVWRSFPQARGSGCQSFDSPCCFISAKCGSSISERFWSLRVHTVCFCALVAILDTPRSRLFIFQGRSMKGDFQVYFLYLCIVLSFFIMGKYLWISIILKITCKKSPKT
jgi:hypothetical protein